MTVFHLDDFLAGWIGGASSVIVGHPLDTVKTRLQAGKGYKNTLHCIVTIYKKETRTDNTMAEHCHMPLSSCLNDRVKKQHCFQWTLHVPDVTELAEILADIRHRSVCIHPIANITSTTKVTGFFKGLSFPLASITLYNSMVFGCFSNTQRLISRYRYGDGRHPSSMLDLTAASMLTGLVSVGVGSPVDLVKIRLQMQTQRVLAENFNLAGNGSMPLRSVGLQAQPMSRGPIHCISTILQNEGIQGLYRGAGAMILRDVPGYALYFIPYTLLCNWLNPKGNGSPHPCTIWLAGGLAGSISWVTATPADVVKSRLQADAIQHRKYNGILHCIMQSYKTEGIQVFFRGATVNAIRGFPMSATMFLGYELSLQFFRNS